MSNQPITTLINSGLSKLYNIEDPIYKALICDNTGTPDVLITKPTDLNLGALTNNVEYLRLLSKDLLNQIYINKSESNFLKYQLETFFKSFKLLNEQDSEWLDRTSNSIFKHKCSKATIINALRPYSSLEPEILDGIDSSMFGDYSFADRYTKYSTIFDGNNIEVYPSISYTAEVSYFSIIIVLTNIPNGLIFTIVQILKDFVATGIFYEIQSITI